MKNKEVLLLGEGIHQHTLYGDFTSNESILKEIEVREKSLLKHELPNGNFGEHETLEISIGSWVMGKQVEYNPFNKTIQQILD